MSSLRMVHYYGYGNYILYGLGFLALALAVFWILWALFSKPKTACIGMCALNSSQVQPVNLVSGPPKGTPVGMPTLGLTPEGEAVLGKGQGAPSVQAQQAQAVNPQANKQYSTESFTIIDLDNDSDKCGCKKEKGCGCEKKEKSKSSKGKTPCGCCSPKKKRPCAIHFSDEPVNGEQLSYSSFQYVSDVNAVNLEQCFPKKETAPNHVKYCNELEGLKCERPIPFGKTHLYGTDRRSNTYLRRSLDTRPVKIENSARCDVDVAITTTECGCSGCEKGGRCKRDKPRSPCETRDCDCPINNPCERCSCNTQGLSPCQQKGCGIRLSQSKPPKPSFHLCAGETIELGLNSPGCPPQYLWLLKAKKKCECGSQCKCDENHHCGCKEKPVILNRPMPISFNANLVIINQGNGSWFTTELRQP